MHRIEDFGNLPEAIDNNVLSCNRCVNICTFSKDNRYLILSLRVNRTFPEKGDLLMYQL